MSACDTLPFAAPPAPPLPPLSLDLPNLLPIPDVCARAPLCVRLRARARAGNKAPCCLFPPCEHLRPVNTCDRQRRWYVTAGRAQGEASEGADEARWRAGLRPRRKTPRDAHLRAMNNTDSATSWHTPQTLSHAPTNAAACMRRTADGVPAPRSPKGAKRGQHPSTSRHVRTLLSCHPLLDW